MGIKPLVIYDLNGSEMSLDFWTQEGVIRMGDIPARGVHCPVIFFLVQHLKVLKPLSFKFCGTREGHGV